MREFHMYNDPVIKNIESYVKINGENDTLHYKGFNICYDRWILPVDDNPINTTYTYYTVRVYFTGSTTPCVKVKFLDRTHKRPLYTILGFFKKIMLNPDDHKDEYTIESDETHHDEFNMFFKTVSKLNF